MKILKIELQNINSLKSDQPIIVDFTSPEFIDTNLFAITGKTGAGKSTILDAITIALYGRVARLQKGSTIYDVVSKGTPIGYARVTFENEGVIYIAYRSMSVLTKNLKERKTKIDEYELSVQSGPDTGKILASTRTEMTKEVKRIVKLSFEQFCKSVLIAQGDFASFLNADEKKKGELLQEITGESIYKQIGYEVQNRLGVEKGKLENLKAKINEDHLLSEEHKIELEKRLKNIPQEEKTIQNKILGLNSIISVFQETEKAHQEELELSTLSNQLNDKKEEHNEDLIRYEDATQLSSIANKVYSLDNNKVTLEYQLKQQKETEKQLNDISAKEKINKEILTKSQSLLTSAQENLDKWIPVFQKASAIETTLKVENDSLLRIRTKEIEQKNAIESNAQEIKGYIDNRTKKKESLDLLKNKLEQEKFLENVQLKLEDWTKITTEWTSTQTLNEQKKAKLESVKLDLVGIERKGKDSINADKVKQQALENQQQKLEAFKEVEDLYEKTNIDLEANKDALILMENALRLSNDFGTTTEKKQSCEKEEKLYFNEITTLSKEILAIEKQVEQAKKSVDDQQRIIRLEEKILNFKKERENLQEGVACNLCGSTEHPFVTTYKEKLDTSKEEKELQERDEILENHSKTLQEKRIVALKAEEGLKFKKGEIQNFTKSLDTIQSEFNGLSLDIAIHDIEYFSNQVNQLKEVIKSLEEKISDVRKKRNQRDELIKVVDQTKEELNQLQIKVAELREHYKGVKKDVTDLESEVNSLDLKKEEYLTLIREEAKVFAINITDFNHWQNAFEDLKTRCSKYDKEQKNLVEQENDYKTLNVLIQEKEESLTLEKENLLKLQNEKDVLQQKVDQLKNDRNSLLDWSVDLNNENNVINDALTSATNQRDNHQKALNEIEKELEKLKGEEKIVLENVVLTQENLYKDQQEIEMWLKESEFTSLDEIRNKLIPEEEFEQLSKLHKSIKDEALKLDGRKHQLEKQLIALAKKREGFEESLETYISNVEELETKKSLLSEEKGKGVATLAKDAELRKDQEELVKQIDIQEKEYLKWTRLKSALGGTNDSFNKFAQHLTLKNLIILANRHLNKMNNRYTLKLKPIQFDQNAQPKSFLTFEMIDHHLADMVRSVHTASGGEKFMISLSLALGLSDLSSKNVKIDSLFIDEGFGTLDETTLEDVMYALNSLQTGGKMIGVISHVKTLNDRLGTKVEVTKHSGGVSTLEVVID